MKKSIVATLLGVTFGGVLIANIGTVSASTDATTPIASYRYVKKTANYHDKSTSDYYKGVWDTATQKWRDHGFNYTKVGGTSKTNVTSYEDNSANGLNLAGITYTSKTNSGHIVSNDVKINRAVFKKYNYNHAERIHVAEHELGHALGLNHNAVNSVSVMNPANRSYGIHDCDVKGMKLRYSTNFSADSVGDPNKVTTIISYDYVKPQLSVNDVFK